jgi:hypothetical protein
VQQVLSCNAFKREFYDFKGVLLEADKEVVAMVREIPMYNGLIHKTKPPCRTSKPGFFLKSMMELCRCI